MNLGIEWEGVGQGLRTRDVTHTVHAEDTVTLAVRLLPILPEAALLEALREALREQGWTRQSDGAMVKAMGSATATLGPDGRSVAIRAVASVSVTGRVTVRAAPDAGEETVEAALDREVEQQTAALQARETARLAQATMAGLTAQEPEVRGELQQALNRTYRTALETRARELGELESVTENGDPRGSYEVTVVVKA